MPSDPKKVQTLINVCGAAVLAAREATTEMEAVRTLYQAANPSTVGTPIDGQIGAINAAINALRTAVDAAAFTLLVNNIVPTHKNNAL